MNYIPSANILPKDVTFFLGPVASPEEICEAYREATRKSEAGSPEALEEFIDLQIGTLQEIAVGENPPLRQLLETLIGDEIENYSAFVAKGFMKRTWVPTVCLHLDRMGTRSGCPFAHTFTKKEGEVVAAMLGQTFKAEWIYTSWAYPAEEGDVA